MGEDGGGRGGGDPGDRVTSYCKRFRSATDKLIILVTELTRLKKDCMDDLCSFTFFIATLHSLTLSSFIIRRAFLYCSHSLRLCWTSSSSALTRSWDACSWLNKSSLLIASKSMHFSRSLKNWASNGSLCCMLVGRKNGGFIRNLQY